MNSSKMKGSDIKRSKTNSIARSAHSIGPQPAITYDRNLKNKFSILTLEEPFPPFDPPRELRDEIYEQAFAKDTLAASDYELIIRNLSAGRSTRPLTIKLAIRLTSKRVCAEVDEVCFKKAVFIFGHCPRYVLPSRILSQLCHPKFQLNFICAPESYAGQVGIRSISFEGEMGPANVEGGMIFSIVDKWDCEDEKAGQSSKQQMRNNFPGLSLYMQMCAAAEVSHVLQAVLGTPEEEEDVRLKLEQAIIKGCCKESIYQNGPW